MCAGALANSICMVQQLSSMCAGAAGEPVGVLLSGKAGAGNEAVQDPAVAGLAQLGYPVSASMEALQRLKGVPDAAHRDLFARLSGAETVTLATSCTADQRHRVQSMVLAQHQGIQDAYCCSIKSLQGCLRNSNPC